MKKVFAILGVLIATVIAVSMADPPRPRADLTYLEIADFNTLDPQRMSYLQDFRLAHGIYEGLVRLDNETMLPEPAGASSWTISDDRRTYTFHLDPDATWSNGDPVTAHEYAYAWQRAIMPDTAADYANLFFTIEGAEAFFEWRSSQLEAYATRPINERTTEVARTLRAEADAMFEEMVSIEVVDDLTMRVALERATPYFLDLVGFPTFFAVHEPTLEAHVSVDARTGALRQDHRWTKPGRIVTNGPYVPVMWAFKREMRLRKNPHYHMPGIVKSHTITIIPIEEENTGVVAYKTGVADWHADVNVDYLPEMLAQKARGARDDVHALRAFGTYFWNFNCTSRLADGRPNPFADARVRRAFALSVDKDALIEKVKRTGETRADVLIPPGSIPDYDSPEGLVMDVARAQQLMREAGWIPTNDDGVPMHEDGRTFPLTEILVTTLAYHKDVALAVGRMWRDALGVRTKVVVRETKVYRDDLKRRDYMIARGGWFGDYGDPLTFLNLHRTGNGNNDRGYSNPSYDALLERAAQTLDDDERMAILHEAERMIVEEELPVLPFWYYNNYYMFDPPNDESGNPNPGGLRNITTHPRLLQYIFELEVVPPDATVEQP